MHLNTECFLIGLVALASQGGDEGEPPAGDEVMGQGEATKSRLDTVRERGQAYLPQPHRPARCGLPGCRWEQRRL